MLPRKSENKTVTMMNDGEEGVLLMASCHTDNEAAAIYCSESEKNCKNKGGGGLIENK